MELWLRATGRNGVVFYNGQMASGRGDFIALNLVDRFLEFRFNLGSGTAIVRYDGKSDRQKDRQGDGQPARQGDGQSDRQTDK